MCGGGGLIFRGNQNNYFKKEHVWRDGLTEGGEMGGKEGESKGESLQLKNRVERH